MAPRRPRFGLSSLLALALAVSLRPAHVLGGRVLLQQGGASSPLDSTADSTACTQDSDCLDSSSTSSNSSSFCAPLYGGNPALDAALGLPASAQGVCTAPPAATAASFPESVMKQYSGSSYALFPLADIASDSSWPSPAYVPSAMSARDPEHASDPVFGQVLRCNASTKTYLKWSSGGANGSAAADASGANVGAFASKGPWAISLWFRQTDAGGSWNNDRGYGYLLSLGRSADIAAGKLSTVPFHDNQIQIYAHAPTNPTFGSLRIIALDSNDDGGEYYSPTSSNGNSTVVPAEFLDSTGIIGGVDVADGGAGSSDQQLSFTNVSDGCWHHLVLSTLPGTGNPKGYVLYLDGEAVATFNQSTAAAAQQTLEGQEVFVPAGDPMTLDTMVLCTRSDLDEERFWSGDLAWVSLYDTVLSPENVSSFYQTAQSSYLQLDSCNPYGPDLSPVGLNQTGGDAASMGPPAMPSGMEGPDAASGLAPLLPGALMPATLGQPNANDLKAIQTLHASIGDSMGYFAAWNGTDPCAWVPQNLPPDFVDQFGIPLENFGVTCNPLTGRVVSIYLENLNLTGTLPDRNCFELLTALQVLDASHNALTSPRASLVGGALPLGLKGHPTIRALYVSDNELSGSIDNDFFLGMNLTLLDLSDNALSGPVPPTLASQDDLLVLDLNGNSFNGSLSESFFASFSSLAYLGLANNSFTGTIPATLSGLQQIQVLDFEGNYFEGEIPSELAQLPNLQCISVRNNGGLCGASKELLESLPLAPSCLDARSNLLSGYRTDPSLASQNDPTLAPLNEAQSEEWLKESISGTLITDACPSIDSPASREAADSGLTPLPTGGFLTGQTCASPLDRPASSGDSSISQFFASLANMTDAEREVAIARFTVQYLNEQEGSCGPSAICLQYEWPRAQCVQLPDGGVWPVPRVANNETGEMERVPYPFAFFPLTGGVVQSFPFGRFNGTAINVPFEADPKFSSVPACGLNPANDSSAPPSYIQLDDVPYGDSGKFAVSLWFRHVHADLVPLGSRAPEAQHLISHLPPGANGSLWEPNTFDVAVMEEGSPASETLRAYVKDADDAYRGTQDMLWLASDGQVGSTFRRDKDTLLNTEDGIWHNVVVTTLGGPDETEMPGFSIYLDGELAATWGLGYNGTGDAFGGPGILANNLAAAGIVVPGGTAPMIPGGPIILCHRADLAAGRQFRGFITHLSLYNTSLTAPQVKALYDSVALTEPRLPPSATYADRPEGTALANLTLPSNRSITYTPRVTVSGAPCAFPYLWQGRDVYRCVQLGPNATEFCKTAESGWDACAPVAADAPTVQAPLPASSSTQPTDSNGTSSEVGPSGLPAAATEPQPAASSGSKSGLSGAAIAGIVFASLAGAALLIAVIALVVVAIRRRRARRALMERWETVERQRREEDALWTSAATEDLPPIQIRSSNGKMSSLPAGELRNVAPSPGGPRSTSFGYGSGRR